MEYSEKWFEANKEAWNKRTSVHIGSDFYDLEGFKNGESSLKHIELEELSDIDGKSFLHLQCHFGMDSLSWARIGAEVTGVDLSDKAIEEARKLNNELNLTAEFVCSNVLELDKNLDKKFDIVFTSYGTIGWLPDINRWGEIVSHFLKPGGIFYIIEFHPYLWIFDDDFKKFQYSYFMKDVIEEEVSGTYADREANIQYKDYSWNHTLSDIINSLINNGLQIQFVHEFPYSTYNCFPNMIEIGKDKYVFEDHKELIPYMYSIKAKKK